MSLWAQAMGLSEQRLAAWNRPIPVFLEGLCTFLSNKVKKYVKGKPVETLGRKAMGLMV
jgi:hypothetical protein